MDIHDQNKTETNCFVAGTRVLTQNGYKPIEDVIKNMNYKFLTHSGEFRTILNGGSRLYSGLLYEISIMYHSNVIKCTPEQLFYVRQINKILNETTNKYEMVYSDPEWKPAYQLKKTDYFGMLTQNSSLVSKYIEDQYDYFAMEYNWKYDPKSYFITTEPNGVVYSWHIFKSIQMTETRDISVYHIEVETDNSYVVENTIVYN